MENNETSIKSHNPFVWLYRFFVGVFAELSKCVTPSVRTWLKWFGASLVFVLVMMVLISGLDFGLGKLTLLIFG